MITNIKLYKESLSSDNLNISLIKNLIKFNIEIKFDSHFTNDKELNFYINDIYIGECRYTIDNNYLLIEMIYLEEEFQRKGIGTNIYTVFYESAKENNLKGLYSPAFDLSSGQQRSTLATGMLLKLKDKIGGSLEYLDEENIDEEDIMYGPPYIDIYIK